MAEYSAQGSIAIRRLRNGDTFFITLDIANGIPLYQGVDEAGGTPSPDWSREESQPVIQPKVTSARGAFVTLSAHRWSYNGVELTFGAAGADGLRPDLDYGKFKLNPDTGALRIVDNLASATNIANDTLTYSCIATVAGLEYSLTKSIEVLIQPLGASAYTGTITASTTQLTEDVATCRLSTRLWSGSMEVTGYTTRWYRDDTEWTPKRGQKEITVNRDDVDGEQLFICEFYDADSSTPCYRAGIRVIDTADEFRVVCFISSDNKDVDTGQPVTVGAKIIRFLSSGSQQEYTPKSAKWKMAVYRQMPSGWNAIKESGTNSIVVTTTETDYDGTQSDVEVVAEVEFS